MPIRYPLKAIYIVFLLILLVVVACTKKSDIQNVVTIDEIKEMHTLSAISNRINAPFVDNVYFFLQQPILSTSQKWSLVWYNADNYNTAQPLLIYQNKYIPNTYAVSVPGLLETETSDKLVADIFTTDIFPYATTGTPMISSGMDTLFMNTVILRDNTNPTLRNSTFIEYLIKVIQKNTQNNEPVTVYFTGLSFGGALVHILSCAFIESINTANKNGTLKLSKGQIRVPVLVFAAPDFETKSFIDYYNNFNQLNGPVATSYKNAVLQNDAIPILVAGLDTNFINNLAKEYPISKYITDSVKTAITLINDLLMAEGIEYAPYTNIKTPDNIPVVNLGQNMVNKAYFDVPDTIKTNTDWDRFVFYNHDNRCYSYSLGSQCVPVSPDCIIDNVPFCFRCAESY
ncbi:MAG: hypothetical protein QM528_08525 [Phycisphaerales bacterium]|nr:hypothetical protein [Phycisphaerales bacterium]